MNKILNDWVASSGVQFGTSGARGMVSAMTPDVCYAYTQAFLRAVASGAAEVVLGHDLRPSSPALAASCIQAVTDSGLNVLFVGALPTPAVAYYASTRKAPAIIITGSHIPFDRNGIKFYRANGEISKADEQAMLASVVDVPSNLQPQPLPVFDAEAWVAYVQRYVSFFGEGALRGMRVGVYEHSSVARDLIRGVLEALGANVLSLGRADTRDAVLPMLALLSMARTRGCKLSELSLGLPNRFTASDRLQNFPTRDSRVLLGRLLAEPAAASELFAPQSRAVVATDTTDGLRMTFTNGDFVHLRPSGNAPELRCYAESESVERATELCQGCLERIRA